MTVTSEHLRGLAQTQTSPQELNDAFYQHYTRIYGVLFRLVGDRAEAEDLTLETFCRLWQEPPAHAQNLGGWLYRVATRLGLNALRAARRRAVYEQAAASATQVAPDPASDAERSDKRAEVRRVLAQMPGRDAQFLVLRYSGMSYKEIAAATGVSPNSVGALLTRAEEHFEKLYRQGGNDAPQ